MTYMSRSAVGKLGSVSLQPKGFSGPLLQQRISLPPGTWLFERADEALQ